MKVVLTPLQKCGERPVAMRLCRRSLGGCSPSVAPGNRSASDGCLCRFPWLTELAALCPLALPSPIHTCKDRETGFCMRAALHEHLLRQDMLARPENNLREWVVAPSQAISLHNETVSVKRAIDKMGLRHANGSMQRGA